MKTRDRLLLAVMLAGACVAATFVAGGVGAGVDEGTPESLAAAAVFAVFGGAGVLLLLLAAFSVPSWAAAREERRELWREP